MKRASSLVRRPLLSKWSRLLSSGATTGLFGNPVLQRPEDFMELARGAVKTSESIKRRLVSGTSPPGRETIRELDAISNNLCIAIDAAELARNVHHEEDWREASEEVFAALSGYIHELNTDVDLYKAVKEVAENTRLIESLSEEEQRTAHLLKAEFESSGIHLPEDERKEVRVILNEITRLETLFSSNIVTQSHSFQVDRAELERQIPAAVLATIPQPANQPHGLFTLSTEPTVANAVLRYASDCALRQRMYRELNTSPAQNLDVLDKLIKSRHALACKLGFPSYAHRFTSDKMAGDPSQVEAFLAELAGKIQVKAQAELQALRNAKFKHEGSTDLQQWDLPYYMGSVKSRKHQLDGKALAQYLPLDGVLRGLALLVKALFNVSMQRVPMDRSEAWTPGMDDVYKVVLAHPEEGVLGTIYLDLYPRPAKYTHHAQFTVQCGCHPLGSPQYQLPVVALVCNFAPSTSDGNTVLLSHGEVESLFHEFGHALHSLLSRTQCQHVAGTRAPVDFVETPSHLLEYFVWDHRFLAQFAKHHRTGEPIPTDMVQCLRASKGEFAALDTQIQLLYSLVDQRLFGPQPLPDGHDPLSSDFLAHVQRQVTSLPHADGTYWHARFGHLTGYGAGYYGYLYDRVFASHIWHKLFAADPLNAGSGQVLWKKLMVHGGGRDPNLILRDVLGEEPSVDCFLREIGVAEG